MIFEDIIYAGDFNAKHTSLSPPEHLQTNTNGRRFKRFLTENNMNILGPRQPTHLRGGRLDYFVCGGLREAGFDFRRLNFLISDHYAIECSVTIKVDSFIPHVRLKINIPVDFVAPFRAHMSKMFHGLDTCTLSGQDIYDIIASNTKNFHDNFLKKNPKNKVNFNSDWTNDPKLEEQELQIKEAFSEYEKNGNSSNLRNALVNLREYSELKKDVRMEHFEKFLQGINAKTSESKVWQGFNAVMGKFKSVRQTKNTPSISHSLLEQYSLTSTFSNLPQDIQVRLDELKFNRLMKIEIACAETHEADRFVNFISQFEIDLALSHGKSTAPGEDGITYQVIRLLNDDICDGINPIQLLFSAIYREGALPWQWKYSIIIPVPKAGSDKFRPISLTSCLCKVFERVILNRLNHTLSGKLSDNLFGFINGKSTNNCFLEYMAAEPNSGVTVFLDIQSAFDTANRTVILEHLASLGIKGELLQIIKDYLSDRYSKLYYKGYLTPEAKKFELGTPQGGVLSPFLFNILMDKLLKSITLPSNNCKIICYADDICIRTSTAPEMQNILDQLTNVTKDLGLVISIPKTKCQFSKPSNVQLSLNQEPVDICSQYRYLGIPVPLPRNYIKLLCERLSQRLRPLKVLANKIAGVNVTLCRMFYIAYVRSLIDYNALYLCTYNSHALKPLETLQNRAMRIILGCPPSTRVILMQTELSLPPITSYIYQIATLNGTKIAKSISHNSATQQTSAPSILRKLIKGSVSYDCKVHPKVFRVIANNARIHNVNLFSDNAAVVNLNPTERIKAKIHIPNLPNNSVTEVISRKSLWLESLDTVLKENFRNTCPLQIYTDGSLKTSTGRAGYGFVVYEGNDMSDIHTVSASLPKWTTNLESELTAIKCGIMYASGHKRSALVISDSRSALQSINSFQTEYKHLANEINKDLTKGRDDGLNIQFMWVPSHVGIVGNEKADALAKAGSNNASPSGETITINQFRSLLKNHIADEQNLRINAERPTSFSIKHYDSFRVIKHTYGKGKLYAGPCDRLAARIRLGYRHPWEVAYGKTGNGGSEFSKCVLCKQDNSNTLIHYISDCSKLRPFRPANKRFYELCTYFCKPENILPILSIYPGFKM